MCWDNQLEPVEEVHLSATLDGVERLVFDVSAYHCANWHVFTVIPGAGLPHERKKASGKAFSAELWK